MVFHWSLSDRKSCIVSRTLLSILAELNNVVVRLVSCFQLLRFQGFLLIFLIVLKVLWSGWSYSCSDLQFNCTFSRFYTTDITVTFIFNKVIIFIYFFTLLVLLSSFAGRAKSTSWYVFHYFVNRHLFCTPGWDKGVCLYLKIPEICMHLIF